MPDERRGESVFEACRRERPRLAETVWDHLLVVNEDTTREDISWAVACQKILQSRARKSPCGQ